jgi:hypothetical protein
MQEQDIHGARAGQVLIETDFDLDGSVPTFMSTLTRRQAIRARPFVKLSAGRVFRAGLSASYRLGSASLDVRELALPATFFLDQRPCGLSSSGTLLGDRDDQYCGVVLKLATAEFGDTIEHGVV